MIELRPATDSDAACLTELAMRSKAHWGYTPEFMAACRDELTVVPDAIESPDSHYVVAEDDGVVTGYYMMQRVSASRYELEALFVEPGRIGDGIGGRLLKDALDVVSACGGGRLMVQSDPNAVAFYLAAGGRPCGTRESGSLKGRALPMVEFVLTNGLEGGPS